MKDASGYSNTDILERLRNTEKQIREKKERLDYYLTEAGQQELLRRAEDRERQQASRTLSIFDYSDASKATLSATGPRQQQQPDEEWIEVEFCADTGACDTVMPRVMCKGIAITPSLQSLACLEYEVANKQTIPNLGERKCLVWTEGASVYVS